MEARDAATGRGIGGRLIRARDTWVLLHPLAVFAVFRPFNAVSVRNRRLDFSNSLSERFPQGRSAIATRVLSPCLIFW